jgi:hypothetical protein
MPCLLKISYPDFIDFNFLQQVFGLLRIIPEFGMGSGVFVLLNFEFAVLYVKETSSGPLNGSLYH